MFNLGDRVVCKPYMGSHKEYTGTIVAISEMEDPAYSAHPFGVLLDNGSSHFHHYLYLSDTCMKYISEYFTGDSINRRLKNYSYGYWFPENKLSLLHKPYSPDQNGDEDDDI